ncbi:MAG: hypothetical protein JXB34_03990 [Bacteroidales bacterium]|nr:hypothetical protein [Bacteroidales bacterium]
MEIFIVSIVIVAFAFVGLGFNIFFRKDGKFPETEVGTNRHMRELGIRCTRCDEMRNYRELKRKSNKKVNYSTLKIDLNLNNY